MLLCHGIRLGEQGRLPLAFPMSASRLWRVGEDFHSHTFVRSHNCERSGKTLLRRPSLILRTTVRTQEKRKRHRNIFAAWKSCNASALTTTDGSRSYCQRPFTVTTNKCKTKVLDVLVHHRRHARPALIRTGSIAPVPAVISRGPTGLVPSQVAYLFKKNGIATKVGPDMQRLIRSPLRRRGGAARIPLLGRCRCKHLLMDLS